MFWTGRKFLMPRLIRSKPELEELEKQYPQYASPDSPTQRIGGKPLDKFAKVVHKARQWSFGDALPKKKSENLTNESNEC